MTKRAWLALGAGLMGAGGAMAQTPPANIAVADRARPAYDPLGWRVKSIFFYPSVAGSYEYDDNVRSTRTNRQSDSVFYIAPQLRIKSDLRRHGFDVTLKYSHSYHAKLTTEDVTNYGAFGRGVFDVTRRTRIRADGSIERATEKRGALSSFGGTRSPVRYNRSVGNIGLEQEMGAFVFFGQIGQRQLKYKDTVDALGLPLDQKFRDFRMETAMLQARLRMRSGLSAFIRASGDKRIYDIRRGDVGFDPITGIDRSSKGGKIEAGLAMELTNLLYGNIRAGYLKVAYDDPALRDVDGISFGADLLWNVTSLTSLRFTADRSLDETVSPLTAGNLRSEFNVGADHELLRNLILSVDGRYARITPAGPTAKSRENEFEAGAKYLLNRYLMAKLTLNHSRRSSDNPAIGFKANSVMLTLTVRK
ncbi:outer membrane beta-barrel protein [Sphingomonas naphthae]|uniref:Outer membrane beta-barrel protein n=1 Tax=Sphingomonas naphthae TaxID=1813468 RepID=A0ABY7THA6_9SPHN|nr:outer membrane beta-barrel protein [Sphingomonas naphthae]WCT72530.1 outer membrane beta-barrel protein [Sphingomonas naphthae]